MNKGLKYTYLLRKKKKIGQVREDNLSEFAIIFFSGSVEVYFLNYFSLFSFIRASIFFSYGYFFNSCTVKVIFSSQVFISLIIIMLFLCSLIIIPSMSHQHHIIIHIPSSHIFYLSPLGFFGNHHFFSFLLSSLLLFSYSLPLYVKRISLFFIRFPIP